MSSGIPSTRRERRIEFHGEAPGAKYDYKFRRRLDIRLAGAIWAESGTERTSRLRKERERQRSKTRPTWFDNAQVKGPDNDYSTVDYIKRTPDLNY